LERITVGRRGDREWIGDKQKQKINMDRRKEGGTF
jgi:hypothetical protein